MGAVLIEKGFALSDSLLYVGISLFGPVLGSFAAAGLVDKVERRHALALCAAAMVVAAIAFAASLNPIWLMASGLVFSVTSLIYVPALSIYTAEAFTTRYRARAATAAWGINRAASALSPLVLLPLLKTSGIWAMYGIMVGALLISIVVLLTLGPRIQAGQSVN
jgi:putative MFS transporter